MQRDDMSVDLHAHGSRELAHDVLPADNQYCAEEGAAEPAAEDAAAVEPVNRQMAEATPTEVEATPSFLGFKLSSPYQCTEYNIAGVIVAASQNRDEHQLVALTALLLAIELFERLNIQPKHESYHSRGQNTSILTSSHWRR